MTTSPLVDEAIAQGAVEMPPYSSIEFSPQPYQKVVVYLSGTPQFDNEQIDYALERFWHGYLKNQQIENKVGNAAAKTVPQQSQRASPNAAQRPQASQGGGGARQNEYPPANLVSTLNDPIAWTCNKCGGTGEGVARRPQKGAMKSDAIVCLNSACKEGDFRYTLAWDDGTYLPESAEGDIDPDDLPF